MAAPRVFLRTKHSRWSFSHNGISTGLCLKHQPYKMTVLSKPYSYEVIMGGRFISTSTGPSIIPRAIAYYSEDYIKLRIKRI